MQWRSVSRWVLVFAIPLALLVLLGLVALTTNLGVRAFGIQPYTIPSEAMVPTLQPGDRFFVDTLAYAKQAPQRGDVVTFVRDITGETIWAKRVIAIGGDIIEGSGDEVKLNGHVLHESYVAPINASEPVPDHFGPVTVPAGNFFVMGDNRRNSNDSRYFGYVDARHIRGKVTYIYWSKDQSRIWQPVK